MLITLVDWVSNLSCLLTVYQKGWVYLKLAQKYYRAIFELVDWNEADLRCRELGAYSRLVDINDRTENDAVKQFIRSFDGWHSIVTRPYVTIMWIMLNSVLLRYSSCRADDNGDCKPEWKLIFTKTALNVLMSVIECSLPWCSIRVTDRPRLSVRPSVCRTLVTCDKAAARHSLMHMPSQRRRPTFGPPP